MIEIRSLSKKIKKSIVLDDISVSMEAGSVYGLQGINGSGKTMLMRCILGLIHPTSGGVFIHGKQIGKDLEFPESVGFLLENPAFLNRYSGYENLKLLASLKHSCTEDDLWRSLMRVGLDEAAAHKKYKKYSLGMKQRLGIAAAVMEKPELVILDEPTNSLDETGVEMVKTIVREEKERGALVVLACHDRIILEEVSDQIFQIREGRIS